MSDTSLGKPASIAAGHFADDNHALRVGMLAGALMKAGITVKLQTDDAGNYTSRMVLELPAVEDLEPPIEVWIKVLSGPQAAF